MGTYLPDDCHISLYSRQNLISFLDIADSIMNLSCEFNLFPADSHNIYEKSNYSGQPVSVAVMGIPRALPLKVRVTVCMLPGARYQRLVGMVKTSLFDVLTVRISWRLPGITMTDPAEVRVVVSPRVALLPMEEGSAVSRGMMLAVRVWLFNVKSSDVGETVLM